MEIPASLCVVDSFPRNSSRTRHKSGFLSIFSDGSHILAKVIFKQNSNTFKLTDNIKRIYDRLLSFGSLSVRLRYPEKDIMLQKADPNALRKLAGLLLQVASGSDSIDIVSKYEKAPPVRSLHQHTMRIKRREDYPLGQQFPPHLTELSTSNLKLRSFDSRLLKLLRLRHLDLSINQIDEIPPAIQELRLSSLILDQNNIHSWPTIDKSSQLATSLEHLSLSQNNIAWLPDDFWVLKNLLVVNLSHLGLRGLPAPHLHLARRLTRIHLDGNLLTCLPFPVSVHTQCILSVRGNSFQTVDSDQPVCVVPSLLECASRVCVRSFSLSHLESILSPRLSIQFAVFRQCLRCRLPCGIDPVRLLLPLPRSATLCYDLGNPPTFICYLCSPSCVLHYLQKSWKYVPT